MSLLTLPLIACAGAQTLEHGAAAGVLHAVDAPGEGAAWPDAPPAGQSAPQQAPLKLPRSYQPTWAASRTPVPGKVGYFLRSTVSPRTFLEAFAIAGLPNITTPPYAPDPTGLSTDQYDAELDAYGNAVQAWGRVTEINVRYHADRLAVGMATAETRQLVSNLILPLVLHQEARYVPAPVNSDLKGRMWNAVSSIVVTQNDRGDTVPNYAKLGGTAAAAILGETFYAKQFKAPELDSGRFLVKYIGYSLAGDMATNVARELLRAAVEPDKTLYNLHGPSTDASYYPMSIGGKFVDWAHSTYGWQPILTAGFLAGLPTYTSYPKEPTPNQPATYNGYPNYQAAYQNWGLDLRAWKDNLETSLRYHGRRFGGALAETESQVLLEKLVIPIAFDMDSRYLPLGREASGSDRLAHAVRGGVITHTDEGRRTINLPVLGGTVGAAFLAKELYYPQLDTPRLASNSVLAKTISLDLVVVGLGNVWSEFLGRGRHY